MSATYQPRLAVRDVDGRPVYLPGVPPLARHRRAYPVEVTIRRTENVRAITVRAMVR